MLSGVGEGMCLDRCFPGEVKENEAPRPSQADGEGVTSSEHACLGPEIADASEKSLEAHQRLQERQWRRGDRLAGV